MITEKFINFTNGKRLVEIICLSTDSKPTDKANGSCLIEMDTSKIYFFDDASNTWKEFE